MKYGNDIVLLCFLFSKFRKIHLYVLYFSNLGNWVMNKRVGTFEIVDAKGQLWIEKYGEDGKRISRKMV